MDTQIFFGKRATATTVAFVVRTPAATDSDTFYNNTAPAQGDCFIFKDGAYDNTADNAPARVTSGASEVSLFTLQLSATEMTANYVDVIIADQDATAFRDVHLKIFTEIELGNVDIDASQGSNLSALKLTGQGTGHGLECIGGATGNDIDGILGEHVMDSGTCNAASSGTLFHMSTGANQTDDYYNGGIILVTGGTGVGQARVITDYTFSTNGRATINKAMATNTDGTSTYIVIPGDDPWQISPGAELSAMPTFSSNYADLLQFLFQRFAYKRTQTSTAFSMKKVDDSTELASATLSDDGSTQTHGRIS